MRARVLTPKPQPRQHLKSTRETSLKERMKPLRRFLIEMEMEESGDSNCEVLPVAPSSAVRVAEEYQHPQQGCQKD